MSEWFVQNARDAEWEICAMGRFCQFEPKDARFEQLGFNLNVLAPGEPMTMYHREQLQEEWFEDAGVLHVSGYALLEQPSAGAAERACEIARAAGARLSIDLACADIVSPLVRERILGLRADIALATAGQAEAIGGIEDLAALPVISDSGLPPVADPMGVADAFAAGYLAALAAGDDPDDAADRGRDLAVRCGAGEGPLP